MINYLPLLIITFTLFGAYKPAYAKESNEVPTRKFEQVKANVVNNNPKDFTIDVYSLANMFVDQEAPEFAVYITTSAPKLCADVRDTKLPYTKPEKYLRRFDLSKHQNIQDALEKYRCVVIKNIPQE